MSQDLESAAVIDWTGRSGPENNIHQGPWLELNRNLVSYVLMHASKLSDERALNDIAQLSAQRAEWDVLTSLASYRFVVQMLFEYLTISSNRSPAIALDMFKHTSQDMSQVLQLFESILLDRASYGHFLSCRDSVAQGLLDLLQDILDSSHELRSRPMFSKALVRLSAECGMHPTCFTLEVKKVGQQVAGGGFGDIWKGLVGGQTVAVKSMRHFADDDVKASLKKLGREALIWRQLSHPNLLPFFGLYVLDNRPCLISPWMENGDLKHFLSNAPADIDRISLIADVAMGLEYLHSKNVVHGDLKTPNILVTPSGRACITDFGLSTIVDELSLKMTFSSRNGLAGTVRYQAPELLNKSPNHYGSDVYAFACVSYEILTGKVPFFEINNDVTVLFQVVQGFRPSRLEVIFPELWLLLEACWHQDIDRRPTMADVSRGLLGWQPIEEKADSSSDWDDTYSARFRRSVQEWPLLPSVDEIVRKVLVETTPDVAAFGTFHVTHWNADQTETVGTVGPDSNFQQNHSTSPFSLYDASLWGSPSHPSMSPAVSIVEPYSNFPQNLSTLPSSLHDASLWGSPSHPSAPTWLPASGLSNVRDRNKEAESGYCPNCQKTQKTQTSQWRRHRGAQLCNPCGQKARKPAKGTQGWPFNRTFQIRGRSNTRNQSLLY